MSDVEAQHATKRALLGRSKPLIGAMDTQLKYFLADSRFGVHRGSSMASLSQRWLGSHWEPLLLEEETPISLGPKAHQKNIYRIGHAFSSTASLGNSKEHRFATSLGCLRRSPVRPTESVAVSEDREIRVGNRVWAFYEGYGQWYEGRVVEFLDDDETCLVFFYNGGYVEPVHVDDIRPYFLIKAGDKVVVDYHGNFQEFYPGTVSKVHPDGRCSIQYHDGEKADKINREQILLRRQVSHSE